VEGEQLGKEPVSRIKPPHGWISVKKRKPKTGRIVLVFTRDETIIGTDNILLGTYFSDTKNWTVYDFESRRELNVTHWMPMPKHP
jgi:hypothetical protein